MWLRAAEIQDTRIQASPVYTNITVDSSFQAEHSERTLAELLGTLSSIGIKTYGQGALATPGLRGTGSQHTQVYWNGIPLNYPTLGLSDLALYPVTLFDEIDIRLGGASLVDGSGGLGGSIQLNNSATFEPRLKVGVGASMASFGAQQLNGSIQIGNTRWQSVTSWWSREADNDFTFVNYGQSDLPVDTQSHAYYQQGGIMQSVYWRPNHKHSFALRGWYQTSFRELPGTMLSVTSDEEQEDHTARAMLEWRYVGNRWHSTLRSAIVDDEIQYRNGLLELESITPVRSYLQQWRGAFALGSQWQLKPILTWQHDETESGNYGGLVDQDRFAAVAELVGNVGERLNVSALVRQEVIDELTAPVLPAMGLRYRLNEGQTVFSLRGNITRNFHAPTLNDRFWTPGGNPDLNPEEGWMQELSLAAVGTYDKSSLTMSATWFNSVIDQWIQWRPNEASGVWSPINILQVHNRGFEGRTTYQIKAGSFAALLGLDYTYTQSTEEEGSNPGKQLIYVAPHRFSSRVRLAHNKLPFWLEYNGQYNGLRYIDADNQTWLPGYWLGELHAGYRPQVGKAHRVVLRASIHNLLDTEFQAIAWRPMPGRHYSLSLKYFFEKSINRSAS